MEKHLKLIELLLAESLLQGEPKPNVHVLESFIGVREGTLAKLQSQESAKKKVSASKRTVVGEENTKDN
jgi:hypothetical protein